MSFDFQDPIIKFADKIVSPMAVLLVCHIIKAIIDAATFVDRVATKCLYNDINVINSNLSNSLALYDAFNLFSPNYPQYYVIGICRALSSTSSFFDWPFAISMGGKNPLRM